VVGVGRVDGDRADEAPRRAGVAVDPVELDGGGSGVGVLGDEHAARARRRPHGAGVAERPLVDGDELAEGDFFGDVSEFDLVDLGADTRAFLGDVSDDWATDTLPDGSPDESTPDQRRAGHAAVPVAVVQLLGAG